ncbi:polyphosphate kinase 2 [Ahniella affigens]|nr:polyphosphate kinase 2 [Ahniella affigens]
MSTSKRQSTSQPNKPAARKTKVIAKPPRPMRKISRAEELEAVKQIAAAAIAELEARSRVAKRKPEQVPPLGVPARELGVSEQAATAMEQMPVTGEDSTTAPLPESYPYKSRLKRRDYEAEKKKLQIELLKMQSWVKETGQRIILVFEGRDAAGKGGAIKRFNEHLNPRGAKVVALEKPSELERGQWYFQRYIQHLPSYGEIVFLDRSWYNRAGVERVMGFCSQAEYHEFLRAAPEFERMLVRSGVRLYKFWFSVSREEQLRRFNSRRSDPLKHWKLSPIDLQSLDRWDDYTEAKEAMFFHTDTADAPWVVFKSDDKKRSRINCMRYFLHTLPYTGKDLSVVYAPDPQIVGMAANVLVESGILPSPLAHHSD